MKTPLTLCLAAASSVVTPASGQELIRISYTQTEVLANTNTPVPFPDMDIGPGEGVRITMSITALINGSSAIGHTVNFTPPPPPGMGTVRGIGSFVYDLVGDLGASSAAGTWSNLQAPIPPFTSGANTGTSQSAGAVLAAIGGSQFVAPGGSVNGVNGIQIFRGVWTPASYSPRWVNFLARGGSPTGHNNSFLVAYGIVAEDPDPTLWWDQLVSKFVTSDFGTGVFIPINIPAPAAPALAVPIVLLGARRRRRAI